MHLGSQNTRQQYTLNGQILEAITEEKDLGVIVDNQLTFRTQAASAAKRANRVLSCIRRTIKYKEQDMIIPLYNALVRPILEYGNVIWDPRFREDQKLIERVQKRATRMIPSVRELDYTARLEALKLPSLQHRRRRGDMIQAYNIFSGRDRVDAQKLFPEHESSTMQMSQMENLQASTKIGTTKALFHLQSSKGLEPSIAPNIIEAETLDQFKARLDKYWQGERFTNPFSI